ncbi:MgtC/SapB family protein [Arthrobacter sp. ok362]|jgi:putative Mg2+ transporter-C (MgtC) family protein|uniref:MgtC/SapB family protein n=1 Tax=Arthrobacter sp. ok362 TaxID=1761745 RepID=UPI00087FE3A1|nr:MgtC/SapB family protein [Arthrobacter sp. ok362]SDK68487.1 putative Mg2+ transporter-C (MgtC) family protein [Arthrobacter sp. ok362]
MDDAFGLFTRSTLVEIGLLLATFVLCSLIGVERQVRQKSAGYRTHVLVGLGSCTFTLISAYGFAAVQGPGGTLDPSRIAAQIVSGIGFLGAGVIFKGRNVVRGLTTAASIWVSAAVGMACGAGMLSLAISLTAFHLITLYVVSPAVRKIPTPDTNRVLHVGYADNQGVLRQVLELATNMGFSSSILSTKKSGNVQKPIVLMNIRFHGHLPLRELVPSLLEVPGVKSVTVLGSDPNEDDDDDSA